MAEFVGQGAHVVILSVVVEKHVGVNVVGCAVGVRTGVLTFRWIHINPALGESALRSGGIFAAKRDESLQNVVFSDVYGILQVDRRDQRCIQIVIMKLAEPHHSFTKF